MSRIPLQRGDLRWTRLDSDVGAESEDVEVEVDADVVGRAASLNQTPLPLARSLFYRQSPERKECIVNNNKGQLEVGGDNIHSLLGLRP